jgi:hydroxymethylbilane synthase
MTSVRTLRIGTRRSALARRQTDQVAAALGIPTEIVPITTEGDRSAAALQQIGGTGVFVTALRAALVRGEIDVAVHSYKDLPTRAWDGVTMAAVPARGDARDALVARDGRTLAQLRSGARVGTGSPRRAAQLRALGRGLTVVPLRGNVDTRVRRVLDGDLDAAVVALAGLQRLSRAEVVTEILDPAQFLPAPAQGALAVEARSDDHAVLEAVRPLDDRDTRACVVAERALLAALEAGCSAPVGALAQIVGDGDGSREVFLQGSVTAVDGRAAVRQSTTGPVTDAEGVGWRLAAQLIANGAQKMMGSSS